ncbi:MAG: SRPBCC family protein [Armatimonadota bacterium]
MSYSNTFNDGNIADASETTIIRSIGEDSGTTHGSPNTPLYGAHNYPNVTVPERLVTGAAGAALTIYAATKKHDMGGAVLALAGGYMLYRAASGHCPGYAMLRTGADTSAIDNPNAVIPHGQGVKVYKTITIQKPASELFSFWRNFENLPRIMNHLESVTVQDSTRSHWVAKAPLGKTVEWDAEIINEVPDEMIAWASTENADIPNAGSVSFKTAPAGRGTIVKVNLEYNPPAGALGAAVARLFGEEPNQQVADDLRRFKSLMEAGEIPTVEGQPQGNKEGYTHSKPLLKATM